MKESFDFNKWLSEHQSLLPWIAAGVFIGLFLKYILILLMFAAVAWVIINYYKNKPAKKKGDSA